MTFTNKMNCKYCNANAPLVIPFLLIPYTHELRMLNYFIAQLQASYGREEHIGMNSEM